MYCNLQTAVVTGTVDLTDGMTDAETTQTEIEKGTGIKMEEETGIITGIVTETEIVPETTTAAPVHPHLVEDAPPLGTENVIVVGPHQPGTVIESAKVRSSLPFCPSRLLDLDFFSFPPPQSHPPQRPPPPRHRPRLKPALPRLLYRH